ncbi:hypothetical protein ACK36G_18645 [Aeromonas veronii]|uniref:hypothetical protein n=1 Tax=Aeromonas TaxID=642 RepID=UPI002B2CC716|nr:hypothetical protein VAWG002_43060 [Aeromonas veronii]
MAYGFEIRNSQGKLLLDSDETVLMFHSKHNVPASRGGPHTVNLQIKTNEPPSVFVSGPGVVRLFKTGDSWSMSCYTTIVGGYGPFEVYVFSRPVPTGIYGLRVFKSNGELQYQSTSKSLNIIDVVDFNPQNANAYTPKTYGVKKIAVNSKLIGFYTVNSIGLYEPAVFLYASGNRYIPHEFSYGEPPDELNTEPSSTIVVDVSRY